MDALTGLPQSLAASAAVPPGPEREASIWAAAALVELIGSERGEWQICVAMPALLCVLIAAVGSDYRAGACASDRLWPSGPGLLRQI